MNPFDLSVPGDLDARLRRWRRDLHRIPEAGHCEEETSRLVATFLQEIGLEFQTGIAGTGLLARIGEGEGPAVLLRADMDGLPIHEETGAEYASLHPGWMHACGHDAHMACLLGALLLLKEAGPGIVEIRILGLFQPAEEVTPGGAVEVVRSGLLKKEHVGAVLGQHVDHDRPVGRIGVRPGAMMAQADEFSVRFTGPGGHASQQGDRPDPMRTAARFHRALPDLAERASRECTDPVLIHIGRLQAGTATNVIATGALLEGTLRTYREDDARHLREEMEQLAGTIATSEATPVEVTWRIGGPPVCNDAALTAICREAWAGWDAGRLDEIPHPSLAAEDFGHLLADTPGVYWRLGIAGTQVGSEPWHTPRFDVDEDALLAGATAMARAAIAVTNHLAGAEGA